MNALATHVGDGRWVVESPRPVAEVDKVVTVPSPSMMSVAGAGPMQPMAAVWPQDGAWVAPFPGSAPGAMTGQGVGAPFMQVPSEPWFEGAGELAEVPEADDHGGCGTNEAFEAAYLAAAAEASARGVIEPGERREALIDALMEEAAQAERAKFEAMVASGEVKVWGDDEDETRFDPQGRPFELPKRLWQRLEEDAATEDETSSATSSNASPSPWLQPSPANPLVPPATWSATDRLHRCGHAVPLHTWTTIPIQGRGGASVDYSYDPVMRKAEAETRVKAKLLTQMHAPPRTLGAATRLQMVDTEAGWAGLVTPVGTKRMSVIGSRAFTKLGKAEAGTDDGSERAHWPLAMLSPKGESASNSTSLGSAAPTQGTPLPPKPPSPAMFAAGVCDDGEVVPSFPGYTYALDIEPGGLDYTPVVAAVVETLHDGWWALERVQRYLPEERALAWNDDRGASTAGNPSMEHHFGPYSKTLLRELQKVLAEAAERWVLGFPRKAPQIGKSFVAGVDNDAPSNPPPSPIRRRVRFRLSSSLDVCASESGIQRTAATEREYIDYCAKWLLQPLEPRVRSLLQVTISPITNGAAVVDWLIERARAQGKSAPYPVARCDVDGGVRSQLCAPYRGARTLRTVNPGIDELLRAAYWGTHFAFQVARDTVERSPADRARGWVERVWLVTATGGIPVQSEIPIPMEDVSTVPFEETSGKGYFQYLKTLAERFPSWDAGWDGAWPAMLRVLTELGRHFVLQGSKSDFASPTVAIEVDVVDALPSNSDGANGYVAWAGPNRLLIRKDIREAPTGETLRELLRVLLELVDDETMAHLHRKDWAGSGGPKVSERAKLARADLAGWVSGRYLVLGGCGPQACFGVDAYSVDRPPLDPMVDATAMKNGQGLMVQVQWALATLDVYAIACTPATGGPTNAAAMASWAGAFGDPAAFDPQWSGHHFLGTYDPARVAQLRAVIDECFQIFGDAGVNLDEVTFGQDVGVYRVVVLHEDDWFDPVFGSGSWRASNPRTLYVKRTATGELAGLSALLQAIIRAAQARMVFKGTWTGTVDAKALAAWAGGYWFRYGACIPNFTSALGKSSFMQQYNCGTQGIRIVGGEKGRRDEIRRRLREVYLLVEAAWRYLRRLSMLGDVEKRVMWSFGESWLEQKLLANKKWMPGWAFRPLDLRPSEPLFPFVPEIHGRCPSLRLWFGDYQEGLIEYLASTTGLWLRRISKGFLGEFGYDPGTIFNHVGTGDRSWHYPPGWVFLKGGYKDDKEVWSRWLVLLHEWSHWLWYDSDDPFLFEAGLWHRGLPRDVKSVVCADGNSTCYGSSDALSLARARTSVAGLSAHLASQNNDNLTRWIWAFFRWNNQEAKISSLSRMSAWPGPVSVGSDPWFPDPLSTPGVTHCDDWESQAPGSLRDVCERHPPYWVSGGVGIMLAAFLYCSTIPPNN